jgi:GGDEF domain-containing protein
MSGKSSTFSSWCIGEVLHQIVTIPTNAPQPIGWLSIGFPMGDPLLQVLGGDAGEHNYLLSLLPLVRTDGREFPVHMSVGIALASQDGSEASMLLKSADQAKYAAKQSPLVFIFHDDIKDAEDIPRRLATRCL